MGGFGVPFSKLDEAIPKTFGHRDNSALFVHDEHASGADSRKPAASTECRISRFMAVAAPVSSRVAAE